MNPDEIKAIQRRLQSKGLYTGPIDGVMGEATRAALRREPQYDLANAANEREHLKVQAEIERANKAQEEEERRKSEAAAVARAERERIIAAQPKELQVRLIGIEKPEDIIPVIQQYEAEQREKAARQAVVDSAAIASGVGAGFGGGILADKIGSLWYGKGLEARNAEIEQLGGRARDVMQLPATDPTRASRLHAVVAEAREAPSRPRIPKEGEDIGPEPDDVIEQRAREAVLLQRHSPNGRLISMRSGS